MSQGCKLLFKRVINTSLQNTCVLKWLKFQFDIFRILATSSYFLLLFHETFQVSVQCIARALKLLNVQLSLLQLRTQFLLIFSQFSNLRIAIISILEKRNQMYNNYLLKNLHLRTFIISCLQLTGGSF